MFSHLLPHIIMRLLLTAAQTWTCGFALEQEETIVCVCVCVVACSRPKRVGGAILSSQQLRGINGEESDHLLEVKGQPWTWIHVVYATFWQRFSNLILFKSGESFFKITNVSQSSPVRFQPAHVCQNLDT